MQTVVDTACNYLNHGLTKKPWTLRNRGYGYPLIGSNDIRPTRANGQFVSTILDSTDIAVLESPKFNATPNFNVLLFQYFRPSQMTTIRLCLGSRFTNPMKTVSSFVQCPSILRSVTAKNAYRWNTVHIQLPPGTTYFYLVAHNSEKSDIRSAIAIDNLRVAICDFKGFSTNYIKEATDFQKSPQVLKLQTF
uniref:MAM domain-containing protein n=1 Tax=Caenorhabditis japonica TaxID=281687 RepID=A0A8R1E3Q3_CAEJA